MRDGFLLDPDVVQLNHGSYGACPIEVFEEYQRFQRVLEEGPTDFFTRQVVRGIWNAPEQPGWLAEARATLAAFVGAPRRTSSSCRTRPRDSTPSSARFDSRRGTRCHDGARVRGDPRTWEFTGATRRGDPDEVVGRIGPRTRAVFVSHISSPTAIVLPVAEICAAARAAGALAIVDGAHAPGQLPLDLARSARTSTSGTATSGSAPRRAPASCGRWPSTRHGSSPWS